MTNTNALKPTQPPNRRCPACGRPISPRAKVTFAKWFTWGKPTEADFVHVGCRHVRVPKQIREMK